jgi:hypothetical protein
MNRDVFICHAREDKEPIVSKIVGAFERYNISFWYDSAEICWGNSIVRQVNEGLSVSQLVLVVLSEHLANKPWPLRELNAMLNMEATTGEERVLPLLVGTRNDVQQILQKFPLLNDKYYISWNGDAETLIKPLLLRLGRYAEHDSQIANAEIQSYGTSSTDVPLFDEVLQRRAPDYYNRLIDIRRRVIPELRKIPITEYSHDSESHARKVLILVAELFFDNLADLDPQELFVLAVFCLVHDLGMRPRTGVSPKQLYQSHSLYSRDYASDLGLSGMLSYQLSEEVAILCLMHKETLSRARIHFEKIRSPQTRIALIFAMFRLADMLDVETQPGEILRITPDRLHQTISEIEIDLVKKVIKVSRSAEASNDIFESWFSFVQDRLATLNDELSIFGYKYRLDLR